MIVSKVYNPVSFEMGTCFTKTEHVSGRQLNMNLRLKRYNSFAFSSPKDDSFQNTANQHINVKDHSLIQSSKSVHGGKGIQCRYNRWISRRQVSFCKVVSDDIETNSSIEQGKY